MAEDDLFECICQRREKQGKILTSEGISDFSGQCSDFSSVVPTDLGSAVELNKSGNATVHVSGPDKANDPTLHSNEQRLELLKSPSNPTIYGRVTDMNLNVSDEANT